MIIVQLSVKALASANDTFYFDPDQDPDPDQGHEYK